MIILDKPYISEFLINTLVCNEIPVIHTPIVDEMVPGRGLSLISPDEAISRFSLNGGSLLYSNSENSISWIEKHLQHTGLPEKIRLFKNKILFRNMVKGMYPNYFYHGLNLNSIQDTDVTEFPFPFIIKPAVGFFSLGVHQVGDLVEWKQILEKIKIEIELISGLYPTEVLHTGEYIIEEFINGEEFAVDCYFNHEGKPVILNIMMHIFSSVKDVNDRLYITSKEIIEKYLDSTTAFLQDIGQLAGLNNFPMHVEVRINEKGAIFPIEVNPLRFGGWCSTPDLAWYAFGINLYEYLFRQKSPDWNLILQGREGLIYSNIVLNNSTGIQGMHIKSFDYDKLLAGFENPLELRKADFKTFPIFGFLFCETRIQNMQELDRILVSDLKEYIE